MRITYFISIILLFLTKTTLSQSWTKATPLPNPAGHSIIDATGSVARCMLSYNNILYVGGSFETIGGIIAKGIAKWNGSIWTSVGQPDLISNDCVNDIVDFGGKIYFSTNKFVYAYDGSNCTLIKEIYGGSSDLHVYQNKLYISSSGADTIFVYNGVSFLEILDPSSAIDVYTIENFQNNVYIGTNAGVFKLMTDNSWVDVSGFYLTEPLITDLEEYNGKLIATGDFGTIGGLASDGFQLAQFDGLNWQILPKGDFFLLFKPGMEFIMSTSNTPLSTHSLTINDGYLYVSGTFGSGGIGSARFNGNSWEILGEDLIWSVHCLEILNNTIFIGGDFIVNDAYCLAKLNSSLHLDQLEKDSIYSIYPNPTTGSVTIKSSEKYDNEPYEIFDQSGRKLLMGILSDAQSTIQLPFGSGLYFLKIRDEVVKVQVVK